VKPNVLHIIDSFERGGTESQMVQLVRMLHESGRYRVHVACLHGTGVLREEIERLKLGQITEYPLKNLYGFDFAAQLRRFARELRALRIDVLHAHGLYTNVFGVTAAWLARVPVRIASRRETGGLRDRARRWLERQSFRLAHTIVANAEAVRHDLLLEGAPDSKIITIHNGIDLRRVEPQISLRAEQLDALNLSKAGGRKLITIVANLRHPVKDHPTFLRAARRVHERFPEAAFVLAGEGGLTDSLRAQAFELGIGADVFFTGRCERIAELLAVSDVCVLSSRAEGFSNSILEYMGAARPVVVTDAGGAREAVVEGETGYIVPAGDDASMAEKIVALLADSEAARRMGVRGRRIVEQKFSCEAQLENTERLYAHLLAQAGRAASRTSEAGFQRVGFKDLNARDRHKARLVQPRAEEDGHEKVRHPDAEQAAQ
jgi:L-malate glycosyltransferase